MSELKNLRIVMLGAGNVATHLALEFHRLGLRVEQVFSRTLAHAQELARAVGADATDDLSRLRYTADLYILATRDDAVADMASRLQLREKTVVHTSGSLPLAVLNSTGGKTGVFYPLQTFTKGRPVNWSQIPVFLEASDSQTEKLLERLALQLTYRVKFIDSEKRRRLHLAAVFVSNFTNHLLAEAADLVAEEAIPLEYLQPLALETVNKAFALGPGPAQTGPALRGDTHTIQLHQEMLESHGTAKDLYIAFTKAIQERQEPKI